MKKYKKSILRWQNTDNLANPWSGSKGKVMVNKHNKGAMTVLIVIYL